MVGRLVHVLKIVLLFSGMDFNQINYPKYRGKKYRYTYGVRDFNFADGEKVCIIFCVHYNFGLNFYTAYQT